MTNTLIEKFTNKKSNVPSTHVLFIIDQSGSMANLTSKVKQFLNEQVTDLFDTAKGLNQDIFVGLTFFSDEINRLFCLNFSKNESLLNHIENYRPKGQTRLLDAIYFGIKDLEHKAEFDTRSDKSFLVIIITDGHENDSKLINGSVLQKIITQKQDNKNWTFVFHGPKGSAKAINSAIGIPLENTTEWEGVEGFRSTVNLNSVATRSYMSSRADGKTQSFSYFVNVDPNNISSNTVKKMTDVSHKFYRFEVKRQEEIKSFVVSNLGSYVKGNAYYQLTKPEVLQENKDIIIFENKTGCLYQGEEARLALKIPLHQRCKLKPYDHSSSYSIFINSTSTNRKLVPGTVLLYKI